MTAEFSMPDPASARECFPAKMQFTTGANGSAKSRGRSARRTFASTMT